MCHNVMSGALLVHALSIEPTGLKRLTFDCTKGGDEWVLWQ